MLEDLSKALPIVKSFSELGLGVVGTMTTIGISIYFVASLAPLLKQLTKAVESVSETNKSVVATLQSINTVLSVHEQRSIDIQNAVSVNLDKADAIKTEVTKICTKVGAC